MSSTASKHGKFALICFNFVSTHVCVHCPVISNIIFHQVPFSDVQRVVEADLGAPLASLYRNFESTPLACGSVAQVHGASLWDGTDVVVKVRLMKVK
jgi:hypothetical protein